MRASIPFVLSISVLLGVVGPAAPLRAADSTAKPLVATADAAGTFKTLLAALRTSDLAKTLEGEGPYTLFAPTDDAFAKLPAGALDDAMKDSKRLGALLFRHVVAGRHLAKDLAGLASVKALDGSELTLNASDGLRIGGAKVTRPDFEATNGVIHAIDAVLWPAPETTMQGTPDSFYALSATSLEGKPVALSAYKGKVTLVVNVASACGYTPQYAGLQALHAELEKKGFAVLGFPSNEFGGQEPGDAGEIRAFCDTKYGVKFPLFEKLVTKPGEGQSPIYAFLTKGREAPNWNFCKYLVGKDGKVIAFYPSKVKPTDDVLRKAIDEAMKK